MLWDPPHLDAPFHPAASAPPCQLTEVLEKAGARATALLSNLQNFSAEEEIEFQTLDRAEAVLSLGSESFEYVVAFGPHGPPPAVQEYRKPIHGSSGDAAGIDIGLPEMAMIFLPVMQGDYEMECEGEGAWKSAPAWVVRFQQRKDRPVRTFAFRVGKEVHPEGLKGRAWIDAASGEILHMETGIMEGLVALHVRNWFLSIDYGPVQFQSSPVKVWLPQSVDGYYDFGLKRTIIYHTFSKFLLFSVQSRETLGKPKAP